MGPHEMPLRERNLVLLAARLRWPEGALEAVRQLEAAHPGYAVYWGTGRVSAPASGYYAYLADEETDRTRRTFYDPDPEALGAVLAADAERRAAEAAAEASARKAAYRAWGV